MIKKKFAIVLSISLALLFFPTASFGQTDVECPDTWQVSTELEFFEKYSRLVSQQNLKYRGVDTSKKRTTSWHWVFDYGGKDIKIFPDLDREPNWDSWGLITAFISPKTPIYQVSEVNVEDCGASGIFKYVVNIPAPDISPILLKSWDSTIQEIFGDEIKFTNYRNQITPMLAKVKQGNLLKGFRSVGDFLKRNPGKSTVPYELGLFSSTAANTYPYITFLLPTQANCIVFESGGGMSLPLKKDCRFAVVLANSKDSSEKTRNPRAQIKFYLVDEFSVVLSQKEMSITCQNKKNLKRIKITDFKCPKGYSKK